MTEKNACILDGCNRPIWVKAAGACSVHYNRMIVYGTYDPEGIRIIGDDKARFWSKVDKTDTCWNWIAKTVTHQGYGTVSINRVPRMAHRITYQWYVGPIPEGYQVDHLCRNIKCVRPDHLEAVTQAENLRRQHLASGSLDRRCSLPDCDRPHRCHGYCNPHFLRWKRHGDPYGGRPSKSR